jgi:recombination protein RecA
MTAKKAPAKKAVRKAPAKKAPAKKVAAKKTTAPAAPVRASARALSSFEEKFTKRFGTEAIRTPTKRKYDVVSTGSLTLDIAMGCGGYVVGRVVEDWGPESVAKTTLALIAIANHQKADPNRLACHIDMERTFDPQWAEALGVDLDRLRVLRPHSSEEVSDMARMVMETGMFSIVVLDSVGGMVTQEEMGKDADEVSVGTAAKVITRLVKQAAVLGDDNRTTMFIVNQVRARIGGHGADTDTGGGWALKHVSTHKLRNRRTGETPLTVKRNGEDHVVGYEIAVHVEKNKVAPPRRVGKFWLIVEETPEYGPIGIDKAREAFDIGKRFGVIQEVSTGRYVLPGEEESIHGAAKVMARLRADTEMMEKIRREMLIKYAEQEQVLDEVPEKDPEETTEVDEATLDFSGATKSEDSYRALDIMRDNAMADAVASAQ